MNSCLDSELANSQTCVLATGLTILQDETSSYVVYMGGPQSLVGLDDLGSTVLSSHLHILDTASSRSVLLACLLPTVLNYS